MPNKPPNMGGERVIRKNKFASKEEEPDSGARRGVLLGAGTLFPIWAASQYFSSSGSASKTIYYDDGDAVTAPAVELELDDLLESGSFSNEDVLALVTKLEETGGAQLPSSQNIGRWVLPWVGGWERLWAGQPDASLFGGPRREKVGGAELLSARQFVYGPGDGGITLEYLYGSRANEAAPRLLLARQGAVSNLGGNYFQLDFPTSLNAYEVTSSANGKELLTPLSSFPAGEGAPPVEGLTLQTTYLSSALWVLRSYVAGVATKQVAVFRRTETRSVLDRRGLVAEGQLKPPDDESIRYGRLLFGETLSDYSGWSDAATKEAQQKDKLFSN